MCANGSEHVSFGYRHVSLDSMLFMQWHKLGALLSRFIVILEALCTLGTRGKHTYDWTTQRKLQARENTRNLWYHGFDGYMKYAFPLDELLPLSCAGRGPDWENPMNTEINDVSGNFSLTLIDVLDTFVVLDDRPGFENAVQNVINWVSFDVDTKPQVFETTIRVLGGLLSGHIFASQSGGRFYLPWYQGELLDLAYDLGRRLLPAFVTHTGIPYARLNLRHGVPERETTETCTAGAGSLILEFATLSRLTGDTRFEDAARKAFFALWDRRSDIGLLGTNIDISNGTWNSPEVSGIGAGVDSFYEYALKWYILSGEAEFLDIFLEAYSSVMRYPRARDGFWYRPVNIHTGEAAYYMVDSLSAFWPGLQVLAGDVQNAIKAHQFHWNIWRRFSGLPEVWDNFNKVATSFHYPLRPEFAESTWYLYRATRDPFYLDVGKRILSDITTRSKVKCGLAGIKDLRTNTQFDRMESFALSETLKYIFLLFDEDNPLHSDDSNYVLTTEGHILKLSRNHLRSKKSSHHRTYKGGNYSCPAYNPISLRYHELCGLKQGVRNRPDIDYARELVLMRPSHEDSYVWDRFGWCETPKLDLLSYEFVLSLNGTAVPEDRNPSSFKLRQVEGGYVVQNLTGLRVRIVSLTDGRTFNIAEIGPYSVKSGQTVYFSDPSLIHSPSVDKQLQSEREITLRFWLRSMESSLEVPESSSSDSHSVSVTAFTALFGGKLGSSHGKKPGRFGHCEGVRVVRHTNDSFGCTAMEKILDGDVLLVRRGGCTFLTKLVHARDAGASGVVVISDEDTVLHPSAEAPELVIAGELDDVAMAVLTKSDGALITAMMDVYGSHGIGDLLVAIDLEWPSNVEDQDQKHTGEERDLDRLLYLNGHPLLNTRLLA